MWLPEVKEARQRLIKVRSANLCLTTIEDKLNGIKEFSRFLSQNYPSLWPYWTSGEKCLHKLHNGRSSRAPLHRARY